MKPLRELTFLGRPAAEWLFLCVLGLWGGGTLRDVSTMSVHGTLQWTVVVAQGLSGLSALGVVLATLVGLTVGIPLLWFCAIAITYAVPMAAFSITGAPPVDVVIAMIAAVAMATALVLYGQRRLHASITRRLWPVLADAHAAAADSFIAAIEHVPAAQWMLRADEEGWSPAEITDHLARTYAQYAGESRGKNSLRIRLDPVRLIFARVFVKPLLVNGAPFPKARAPRSLRPAPSAATPADGVALFRATGESCLRDFEILVERRPYARLIHPYLGPLPLYETLHFASLHIHHHRRQLARVVAQLSSMEKGNALSS